MNTEEAAQDRPAYYSDAELRKRAEALWIEWIESGFSSVDVYKALKQAFDDGLVYGITR